ncbi:hypothetical protein VZ95_10675 [Elstera litoralis]|uniref:Uncharacterized protein n=1 Tax=Elstera litoralis TaxID=552518 RepID=A0A0F3IS73_9PROT|nr:hypothetical protein VZ95_10675 [Elstera litoralis]
MEKLIVKIAVLSNRLTLAGLLSLAVCAFAFYSFNSRSMADDFFRIAEIRSTSVFPRAIFEWNAFNPRFYIDAYRIRPRQI